VRKPRDWPVEQPGDLVEVDTLEVRPVTGRFVPTEGMRYGQLTASE
jgi:hypothetical protein